MSNDDPVTPAPTYEPSPFAPFNPIEGYEPERARGVSGDAEVTRSLTPGTSFGPVQLPYKARTLIIDNPTNQMWFVRQAVQWVPKYTLGFIVKLNPTDTVEILAGFPTTFTAPAPIVGEQAFVRFLDTELVPSTLQVAPFSSAVGGGIPEFVVRTGHFYGSPSDAAAAITAIPTNTLFAMPFFLPQAATFDRIGCFVVAAGNADTVVRMGIYNDDAPGGGAVGGPGTLVLDAGNLAIAAGINGQTSVINQALVAGRYWLAIVARSAVSTPTLVGQSTFWLDGIAGSHFRIPHNTGMATLGAPPSVGYSVAGVVGALPSPWGALVESGDCPQTFLRGA